MLWETAGEGGAVGGLSPIVFPPRHLSLELGIWAGLLEVDESKETLPALFLSEFESLSSLRPNPSF